MKKMLLVVMCIVMFTSATALADDASKKEAILRLLEVTNARNVLDQITKTGEDMMKRQAETLAVELPPEGREALKVCRKEIAKWSSENLSWDRMKNMYADIYAQVFTEDEINELVRYHQSPLGQKMQTKMPELIRAVMQKIQAIQQKAWPEFQNRLMKTAAEFGAKNKKTALPAQGEPPKISGQDVNGEKLPLSREGKWGLLIGTWFGSQDTRGGEKYMWISEKKNDGTERTSFRTTDRTGKKIDKVEVGEWGVSGDVFFTIYKADLEGDKIKPANVTDPTNRDAYKILKLTDEVFEYEGLDSANRYAAKKVAAGFTFPE
jgi:hypothetical protein